MFSSISAIRNASREPNSTVPHWFDASAMRFFNTEIYPNVFPIGQRGAIFITSEYMDDPALKAFSLRYASQNEEGELTIETIDGFGDYEDQEAAEEAADAYQRFYRTVMGG
jgi:hypothetical protein